MYYKAIILLTALFLLTNCQKESLNDIPNDIAVDARRSFPDIIPLPNGFAPEGIVAGNGNDFYVGSLAGGSIYKGDFRTGTGELLFPSETGRIAVGLDFDSRTKYLYVAGGSNGTAYIIDTRTGEEVASYNLGTGFINDVIVTKNAAYFTNSFAPNFYKVPLSPAGEPAAPSAVETLTLSGDYQQGSGFGANGIEALSDGSALIIVNSSLGTLYLVSPNTGEATLIDLNGETVINGDGILLAGKTLYVVQNQQGQIAEIRLSSDYLSGDISNALVDGDFDVPTTVTRKGSSLYVVNARFGTPVTPNTKYDVVKVGE